MRFLSTIIATAAAASACAHAGVAVISPFDLATTLEEAFDDAPDGSFHGRYFAGGLAFGAVFVGQVQGTDGDFDTLTAVPTGPLDLVADVRDENLYFTQNAISGLGEFGPTSRGIGEGSIAILFGEDQLEFGIDVFGGNGGIITFQFFRRDGSLIDALTVVEADSLAFRAMSSADAFAGLAITNRDPGGVAYDNIKYGVTANPVPVPPAALLMGAGLLFVRRLRNA